jgi:hypothetical protein
MFSYNTKLKLKFNKSELLRFHFIHPKSSQGIAAASDAWEGFVIVNRAQRSVPDLPYARRDSVCLRRQPPAREYILPAIYRHSGDTRQGIIHYYRAGTAATCHRDTYWICSLGRYCVRLCAVNRKVLGWTESFLRFSNEKLIIFSIYIYTIFNQLYNFHCFLLPSPNVSQAF